MTDHEKINTLRDALKRITDSIPSCDDSGMFFTEHFTPDGEPIGLEQHDPVGIIGYIGNCASNALAMTAEASEPAPDEPTPWHERMAAHYEQGGKVICHPTKFFMQQEIDDWRERSGK